MTHAHHEPAGGEAVRDEALRLLRAADLERHFQRMLVARRRGPYSAPIAADKAADGGANVDDTTRAANVPALKL